MQRSPENGVVVEILGGVKPKEELGLSFAFSMNEHIGLKNVRIPINSPQEFKVYLVMKLPHRRHLNIPSKLNHP